MRIFASFLFLMGLLPDVSLAAAPEEKPVSLFDLMGVKPPGLRGTELDAAVRSAAAFPLGSEKNPIRATGLAGQRQYLASLRCSDGRAPKVRGRGIGSPSPFGGITDIYLVACTDGTPAKAQIAIDMYHEHVETRAVQGFTIVKP